MTDDGTGARAPKAPLASPAAETAKAPEPAETKTDVVLLGPPTADGAGVHVLRARDTNGSQQLEAGELRTVKEGRPIVGELVSLEPRPDNPRVCDVRESYRPSASVSGPKKGPAQVATKEYRDNWDEVFGARSETPAKPRSDLN